MYDTHNVACLKYTRSCKTHYVLLVLLPPTGQEAALQHDR